MSELPIRAKRPIVGHPIPVKVDLLELGLITRSDLAQARTVTDRFARWVNLDGTPPASTLEFPAKPLQYRIADGFTISNHLPNIMNLYRTIIPDFVRSYIGLEICPSKFERSAITLNLLDKKGSRYEIHTDSNSVTGLLFATTLSPEDGGALRLYYPEASPLEIQPVEGTFLLYDARWVPHEVLPLQRDISRLTLPMNYFLPTDIETRPKFLDSYIFGESEQI